MSSFSENNLITSIRRPYDVVCLLGTHKIVLGETLKYTAKLLQNNSLCLRMIESRKEVLIHVYYSEYKNKNRDTEFRF